MSSRKEEAGLGLETRFLSLGDPCSKEDPSPAGSKQNKIKQRVVICWH
jgi:hypothetical protein